MFMWSLGLSFGGYLAEVGPIPTPPTVPLLRAFWPLFDGICGGLQGELGGAGPEVSIDYLERPGQGTPTLDSVPVRLGVSLPVRAPFYPRHCLNNMLGSTKSASVVAQALDSSPRNCPMTKYRASHSCYEGFRRIGDRFRVAFRQESNGIYCM